MGNTKNYGCLALLFGLRRPETQLDRAFEDEGHTEGDIHSGPGGYEGMGYAEGYASDHFGRSEDQ